MREWLSQGLTPPQFFTALVVLGIVLLLLVYFPVQLASKLRRLRRARRCLTCRICGYRFIRRDAEATCPNCGARNRG